MRKVNSLGNRLVALALSIVMVLGMFPVGTVTAVGNGVYGNVTTLTGGSVTGNGTENVDVIVEETTLQWSAADTSIGRNQDGWWVGIDVVAPDGYSANATYKVKTNPTAEYGEAKSFADYKDGDKNIQLWFPVSPESLIKFASEGRNLTMTYAFDWDADGYTDQTIVFSVKPSTKIILQKDGEVVYPLGTVTTLTGGTVTGNGTENVTILVENATLQWSAADTSIGRYQDGWWVGIDVVAPAYFNQNAAYKVKTSPTGEYGAAKLFKDYKDGDKNIGLWFPVSPESLNKFMAENRNLTMTYTFDWDGNGTYEQTVVFSVKPSASIVLKKGDVQHYPAVGTVNPLTGGTVTGNGTANVEVVIWDTTLQWSPADPSIGRNQDGWWVGIDVSAPNYVANNATYKVKTNPSAEYGEAKSFADYKDGDKNIQLWFPVSPESLKKFASEERNLTMTYRFDWDGDGVYDQTIAFSVDPNGSITLKKGSVHCYPELGDVSTYTGGTVTGNKTSDVSVVIEDTVLQWSPADPSIGRNQDGWWVGIRVAAPENYEPVLMGAKYQTKSNPNINWDDITEVKSFWDNKDTPDGQALQYIQLWFPVTPASLEKFKNENRNMTMVYRFDWEGNGEYDQTVTFSVVPSEKIVLTKVEQTGFAFVEPNPVDKWVGESYTNTASGGQGTGAVTYAITSGADVADIDAATGKLTFKKVGTVTVTATKAADDTYAEVTATYTVKSIKYPQAEFKFENSNSPITLGFATGSFTNVAGGGSGEGAVTYSIISGNEFATIDESTGKITFIRAGSITVVAKKTADANYNETTATYTLVIEKSAQSNLVLSDSTPSSIVYNTAAQSVISVSGGNGNGGVTYSIIEGNEYATINSETGAITTLKAGGSFTVQVNKAGDDGYNAATPITKTIYVDYADQKDFVFATKNPTDVIYNDNSNKFTNTASGGLGTGTITYAFKDAASDAIADIDATTGELTILASGTITVVATKAGDDCYKAITAEYTLKVEKDTPEFTVGDVQLVYGATEHQININTILGGSGKYVYSIEGTNNIGAAVDANGVVTFENSTGKVGTITIKVKKEADTQYVEAEKTFTLTVSYHQPTAQPTVNGDTKNESGWYTGVVTIYAPEGYQISYGNDLTGITWSDTVTVNTDGDNAKNVYLKKGSEISGAISFDSIKIDTAAPVNVDIKYNTSFLETVLQAITFGIYQADEVTVTLTATDTTSGVDYFTYNVGGEDVVVNKADFTKNENGVAEYEFTIPAQFRNKVTMKVTDVAGWTSEWTETEHTLVVDTISPVLDVKYEFAGSQNRPGAIYSNDDVTVKFEITESNFDLRKNDPVFKVGSMTVALTWAYDEEAKVWKAEQLLSGDNTYDLSLTYSDESGNAMTEYAQKVIIDSAAPVISSSYGTVVPVKDNIFNTSRTATFTITESNFNAQDVVLTVIAKNITGTDVDVSAKGYAAYAQNPDNWTSNGNVHTITLPAFDIDAVYTVDIAYTDLAKNEAADYAADEFIIDKADANSIKIEYNTSIVDKILETVTFGFYKADVQVTVTAEDITSGVDYFIISYIQNDGANNSNKVSYTTDPIPAVQNAENKNVFTATHTITADARGTVSVKVVDNAKNDSDKEDQYVVVADTIAPGLEYQYTFTNDQVREYNNIFYTQGETKVKFTITEANFDLSLKAAADETVAPAPALTVNDVAQDITWTQIAGTDKWETEITLTGNDDYVIELSYTDRSTNAMATYTKEVHIDNVAPVFDVTYDNNEARNDNNYKADRTATVKITEHNFKADEVVLVVTAKDITGAPVDISDKGYTEYAKNPANWTQTGDVWTLNTAGMKFDIDAIYNITLNYTDLAENAATEYATEFVLDKTIANADNVTIEYTTSIVDKILETVTFGFYQGPVQVKVTVKDQTAGVEYFEITYTQADGKNNSNKATYTTEKLTAVQDENNKTVFTATHIIEAEARGTVSVNLIDKAGNTTGRSEDYVIVADTIAPGLEYQWTFTDDQVREYNNIYYTKGETKVKFTITEANFDLSLIKATGPVGEEDNIAPTPLLTVNHEVQPITWTQIDGTDKWETEITLTGNDDYVIQLSYTDRSTNAMATYTKEVHIDNVAPVFDVTYDNNDARNENNYKADRTATIKVTEHTFEPGEVKLTVTAKDITGAAVDISSKAYADYAKNPANWTQTGDVWTLNTAGMEFDIDAIYSVKLEYTDLAENAATTYVTEFVVDKTISSDVTIEYSTSIVDKVLETVTFGLYKGDVVVAVTAKDQTAGVEYFEITYTQVDGANNSNKATYTTEKLTAVQDASDKTVFTATHTIKAEARGKVSVNLIDKAGNTTGKAEEYVVVADTIAPGLEYKYTFTNDQVREYNNIFYTKGETKVKFTITEANFDLSLKAAADETVAPAPVLTVNDVAQDITWTQIDGTDKWETEITLTGNDDYVIELSYTDRSTNAMATYTKEVHIDNEAPVFDVTYDNNEARNENNYKAERTATIKVTEHNFEPAEVKLTVTAKDITGAAVDISSKAYADYAKNPANWTCTNDVWTLNTAGMEFDIDAIYSVKLEYTDLAENDATTYTTDFVIDKTVPANIQIKHSTPISDSWNKILNTVTFGYYPYTEKVEVTLIADDITSGVDFFTWTYTKEANTSDKNKTDETKVINKEDITYSNNGKTATASFVIDAQARGYISVDVTDKAGNTSGKSDNTRINVVDTIAPTREVSYQPERVLDAATFLDVSTFVEGDNVILYYEKEAVVTFTINEANFYAEDVVIKVNGVEKAPTDWTQNGDVWTGTITISGDGDYVVTMTYTDRSTNEMVAYQSQKIAIDNTDPTIKVEYNNNDALNTNNYKADRTATITIVEHNFRADDVKVTVTARDVQGNPITVTDYAAYLSDRSNWTTTGDTHVAKITYSTDAIYTFDIEYTDLIGNSAEDFAMEEFVIDHAAPTNLKIEYSDSVVEKIIEAITFGFYKSEVIVTLTADDITAGVDYFDWTYTKEDGTSDKNAASNGARITAEDIVYSNNGLTATATFKIPANARGYVSAIVTDRAGNNDSKVDDKHINVVDNIAPTISVKYEADNADTLVQFTDKDLVTVESFEKAAIAHYNGNVTAKIVINEANFFEGIEAQDGMIYNVGIKLTKTDDNGNETVYEYLPAGAVQKYAGATPKYITWTTSGDEHSFSINYTDNADYVLEIDYTDLSSNEAGITANDGNTATKAYKSKVVTVDKIAPVVSVKYGNEKIIHTIDGRDYFDAEQTATITVEEHNFRADDFAASVIAKNILGDDVNVENFKATLSDDSKWTKNGNTYTITIKYSVDANYTFDYEYKDLAQNAAAEYTEDLFTVDTTAPENLTVTYSTSVLDKVLESITFGYYNAEMTVTITAEDDTAGIYYFVYSYVKSEGVSDVNKELINDKIEDANSRIVHEGKKSTTSFTIPKLLLANDNQFNGTVKFTAFDRSENNTEKVDNQRIVVDNIAPTATITYNQPVQNANNISYYAGNIDAKIVINEANFYSEDVVVTVTRDGANHPVNVKWVDDSVDVHTGTFTLSADGDYIVTVEYKDCSNNQMTKYTSNRLTLDTKAPSVSVSNIKNNSANKDEKYGFTITATDINLDASSFKPVLTATVRKDDGSYETKTVSLGDMKTVEAGKTYTFTVDNLEEDAVYSLVCTLKDMSGNQYSKIVLSDNESYDEVRFSINRNGSTFAVDKDTDALVNQYYVYSVNEDVVIEEVNVDPVETYVVKLNGEKLTEGTDYTTTLSNKDGEWSKRTYIISKDLFESEGEYSIVVESTDKAETTAYSDVKNLNVSFVVDQTVPVLTISGLENGGRYQVEEQTVTIIPTDDGGRLYSIKVVVLNSDGEPLKDANGQDISVRFEMSGEDFLTYLTENGGKVTFTVPEGLENQVQIICNDYAVNADGETNEFNETFTKVTVSQSQWIIFYANKPLFYGTIAGVVLLAGGIVALIVFLKKKKAAKK